MQAASLEAWKDRGRHHCHERHKEGDGLDVLCSRGQTLIVHIHSQATRQGHPPWNNEERRFAETPDDGSAGQRL